MPDAQLETRTPEQMTRALTVAATDLMTKQTPYGPVLAFEVQKLLDFMSAQLGVALANPSAGKRYASVPAALADAGLPVGSYFDVIPSAYGGGFDTYIKTSGVLATFQQSSVSTASVLAADIAVQARAALMALRLKTMRPNAENTIGLMRTETNYFVIRCPIFYTAPYAACSQDYVEFGMKDAGAFMGIDHCPTLNSVSAEIDGVHYQFCNLEFADTGTIGVSDTGLQPSTPEFALKLLKDGDPIVDGDFVGPYHGWLRFLGAGVFLDGVTASNLLSTAVMPVGSTRYGDALSIESTYNTLIPGSGEVASYTTVAHGFSAAQQLQIDTTHDFSHPDVECGVRIRDGYTAMNPTTGINTVKANGSAAVAIVAEPGTASYPHGRKSIISAYHSNRQSAFLSLVLAFGVPQRVNGVDDNWTHYLGEAGNETLTLPQRYGTSISGKTYVAGFARAPGAENAQLVAGQYRTLNRYQVTHGVPA